MPQREPLLTPGVIASLLRLRAHCRPVIRALNLLHLELLDCYPTQRDVQARRMLSKKPTQKHHERRPETPQSPVMEKGPLPSIAQPFTGRAKHQ